MSDARAVAARAPAKVNLALAVGGPRPDGYHDLATVFQALSLGDEVVATAAPAGVQVAVEGPYSRGVPLDEDNLAVRAARLLARRTGVRAGVHLHLHKGIPVAGGLAGGSADAAAALVACDLLWDTGLTRDDLRELAAELGSDVPFALLGGTAVGTGRGERLTPALARGTHRWVLGTFGTGLSTPRVYAEVDRLRAGRVLPQPRVPDALMSALRSGNDAALGAALHNDLQPAACSLEPRLERALAVGTDAGALGAIVSGSGPTVAFLVVGPEQGRDVQQALLASGTVDGVVAATSPAPGARQVEHVRAG